MRKILKAIIAWYKDLSMENQVCYPMMAAAIVGIVSAISTPCFQKIGVLGVVGLTLAGALILWGIIWVSTPQPRTMRIRCIQTNLSEELRKGEK